MGRWRAARDPPSCLSWAALQGPPPKCSPSLLQLCLEWRKGARMPPKAKQPPSLGRSCFSLASGHSPSDLRPSWSPQTGLRAQQTWPGPSQGSHARSPPAPHSAPPSMRPPWSGFLKGRGTGTEPVATRMQDRLHTAVPPALLCCLAASLRTPLFMLWF